VVVGELGRRKSKHHRQSLRGAITGYLRGGSFVAGAIPVFSQW